MAREAVVEIQRRTVLQAGGVIAVGGLVAACSSGGGDAAASSAAADTGAASTAPSASAIQPTAPGGGGGVAQVSDIPVGGGVIIDDPAVVITQPTEGDIKAFTAICPHQGCLVNEVVDNEIICPCHGSRFSASDGAVINGPAQEPLQPAGVAVDGGAVILG